MLEENGPMVSLDSRSAVRDRAVSPFSEGKMLQGQAYRLSGFPVRKGDGTERGRFRAISGSHFCSCSSSSVLSLNNMTITPVLCQKPPACIAILGQRIF